MFNIKDYCLFQINYISEQVAVKYNYRKSYGLFRDEFLIKALGVDMEFFYNNYHCPWDSAKEFLWNYFNIRVIEVNKGIEIAIGRENVEIIEWIRLNMPCFACEQFRTKNKEIYAQDMNMSKAQLSVAYARHSNKPIIIYGMHHLNLVG